ncbi:MAG: hypothetical protein K8L97_33190 [Anaerolineae bacterium]|nr:hypothetical protein [Anaerolineae bacterium]
MKLTFTFTDMPDLKAVSKYDIWQTQFEIPDEAKHLIGYEERILAVAQRVGQLTCASLHFTCKELGIKNHFIPNVPCQGREVYRASVNTLDNYFMVKFSRFTERGGQSRLLRILNQRRPPMGRTPYLLPLDTLKHPTQHHEYVNQIKFLAEQLLMLLNAEPAKHRDFNWICEGFDPRRYDGWQANLVKNRYKKRRDEERKQQREEEKRQKQAAKLAAQQGESGSLPQTGAGRRPGAIPGVFKGVQFRSQLEIRFATELEERKIRWAYEAERLGDGQYLVDFHLPDYKCWVEVKGKFEPRDHFLLKDTAAYLARERGERLFVYTQGKGYVVQADSMDEIKRGDFWNVLLTPPST